MLRNLSIRVILVPVFALIACLSLAVATEAGSTQQEGPVRTDCHECHESTVNHWQASAHGQATADPIFQAAWQEKGSPSECLACHTTNYDPDTETWESDGIGCATCHFGQTGPHPETPMPTDPSSRLCGTCHVDTHSEWQVSAHGKGELSCSKCHNPHTTSLKAGSIGDLCISCHNEEGYHYGYTGHAKEGLLCTDCHLSVSDSPIGEGHGKRVHTFSVSLDTCNECHVQEMHRSDLSGPVDENVNTMWTAYEPANDLACEINEAPVVTEEPTSPPTQPYHYLLVAAVGIGFGVAVTPAAEGWLRRRNSKD